MSLPNCNASSMQNNAEVAVREMLKEIATKTKERTGRTELQAVDHLDDGSPIKLRIQINETDVSSVSLCSWEIVTTIRGRRVC